MRTPSIVLLAIIACPIAVQSVTLIEALKNAGASDFAALITSNPDSSALYASSSVKTIFAPVDGAIIPQPKGKRDISADKRRAAAQGMQKTNSLADQSAGSGLPMDSNDNTGNRGGAPAPVVSNPLPPTNGSDVTKRWAVDKRANSTYPSLLRVFSGLGRNVSIIKADIPYDGGLIHITDGYFTFPTSLSGTAKANGHTTFASLGNSTNMTASLDSTPSITAFIPTNAAFSQSNQTMPSLSSHIIPSILYLPSLKDGATYTTQGGGSVTIRVRGNDYFVNNARIVASNQILDNGVAHVVDQVIIPTAPPVFVSQGVSFLRENTIFGGLTCFVASLLL